MVRADASRDGANAGAVMPNARARATILSYAARLVMSGHDGVTVREVVNALRETTCARAKQSLVESGVNHAREESARRALEDACARGEGWIARGGGEGGTSSSERIYDFPGREYRPPRSWLGAGVIERAGQGRRKRAPHASVRDVLRLCCAATETRAVEDVSRERGFGDAASSPENRRAPRTTNPLIEIAEREKARAAAKESKAKKKAGANGKETAEKKKRKVDLANEKAGNHLALIRWLGEGKKDGVRQDRTFYEGFSRDGVEFKTGDCVYCLPERTNEDMYLAQIQRCFEDEDKSMMIECCWFMTQDEVRLWGGQLPADTAPEEIFLGTSVDVNPIAALEGKAPVFTHEAFKSGRLQSTGAENDPTDSFRFARRCYVPVHGYDPNSKNKAHRRPGTFHPLEHAPGRGFTVRWPEFKNKSKKTSKK